MFLSCRDSEDDETSECGAALSHMSGTIGKENASSRSSAAGENTRGSSPAAESALQLRSRLESTDLAT